VLTLLAALSLSAPFTAPAGGSTPPGVGDPAALFAVPDLEGRTVDLAETLKGKVALVALWATWCQPCLAEIPTLRRLETAYGARGLMITGVGLKQGQETPDGQKSMAQRQAVNYPLFFDAERAFQSAYGLKSLPYTILVGADGTIRWQGAHLPADLESQVQALLGERPPGGGGSE